MILASSLCFRNAISFALLRNQMLIASSSVAKKIIGIESSVKNRDILSLESSVTSDEGNARLYWIHKLSDNVCARPWSAANKASWIFPILSNDLHMAQYDLSWSSRKFIFQSSSDFRKDLKVLKTFTAETNLSQAFSNCPREKYPWPILWWDIPSPARLLTSIAISKCFSWYSMAFRKSPNDW